MTEKDQFVFDLDRVDTSTQARRCLWGKEIENVPVPQPLIDGILDKNTTCMLYGPSGHYKSFLAQSWALSVATGLTWYRHGVEQGYVLYIVGEGYMGMGMRQRAWLTHNRINVDPGVAYLDGSPNLLDPKGREELIAFVSMIQPTFTVIDTIARAIPGGVENDFQTMSWLVECMDRVKRETDGTVLGVHHSGKDAEAGARGHSSLYGAMDTVLKLSGGSLYVDKQKHHEDGYTLATLKTVHLPPSLIVEVEQKEELTANEKVILETLKALGGAASFQSLKEGAVARRVAPGSVSGILGRLKKEGVLTHDPSDDPNDPGSLYRLA